MRGSSLPPAEASKQRARGHLALPRGISPSVARRVHAPAAQDILLRESSSVYGLVARDATSGTTHRRRRRRARHPPLRRRLPPPRRRRSLPPPRRRRCRLSRLRRHAQPRRFPPPSPPAHRHQPPPLPLRLSSSTGSVAGTLAAPPLRPRRHCRRPLPPPPACPPALRSLAACSCLSCTLQAALRAALPAARVVKAARSLSITHQRVTFRSVALLCLGVVWVRTTFQGVNAIPCTCLRGSSRPHGTVFQCQTCV